jgi:hypothetical protein
MHSPDKSWLWVQSVMQAIEDGQRVYLMNQEISEDEHDRRVQRIWENVCNSDQLKTYPDTE